jgi:hypothetical protein
MTLGCGGYGGNITSDNISPRHLLNIKRLAYEIAPARSRFDQRGTDAPTAAPAGIPADALITRIDAFLGSRGYKPETQPPSVRRAPPGPVSGSADGRPLDFVCEEDVRQALKAGRKLLVSEKAIITPAARELGDEHRMFTLSGETT